MIHEMKVARTRALYNRVSVLCDQFGEKTVGRGAYGLPSAVKVELAPCTFAVLHPDRYIRLGWMTPNRIGIVINEQPGTMMMEIIRFHRPVLQANVTGDEIDLHQYVPGAWELDVGMDPSGDTHSIIPGVFIDPADPLFQAWLAKNPRPASIAA
jgi:hypothetical protein